MLHILPFIALGDLINSCGDLKLSYTNAECCSDNDTKTFTKDSTFVGGGIGVLAGTRGNTRVIQVSHKSKLAIAHSKRSYGNVGNGGNMIKEYDLSADTPIDPTKQDRQCQLTNADINQMTADDDYLYAYNGVNGPVTFTRIKRPTTNNFTSDCEMDTFKSSDVGWGRRADVVIAEGYLVLYGRVGSKGTFMKVKLSDLQPFSNGASFDVQVESKSTKDDIFSFFFSVGAMQSSGKYVWAMDSVNYNVLDVTKSWDSEDSMMSMKPPFFQPNLKNATHYLDETPYDYDADRGGYLHQTYHIGSHNSFATGPDVTPSGCSYSIAAPIYFGSLDWYPSVLDISKPDWSIIPQGGIMMLRVCPPNGDTFPTLDHCVLDKNPRWAAHVNNAVVNDATNEFYFSGHTNLDYESKEREEVMNAALNMTLKRHYRQGIAKAVANWDTHVCELKIDKFPNPQENTPTEPFTNEYLLKSNRMDRMRTDVIADNLSPNKFMSDYGERPLFGDTPVGWAEMNWATTTYGKYVYTWGRGNFRAYEASTMKSLAHTLNVYGPWAEMTTPQLTKMYVGGCYDYKYFYQAEKCCEKAENTTLSLDTLNAHIKGTCENDYDKQVVTGSIIDAWYNKAGDCDTFIKRSANWDFPLEYNSTLQRNVDIIMDTWMSNDNGVSRSINVAPGADPNLMLWEVCPQSCYGCTGKYYIPPPPPACPDGEYPLKVTLIDSYGDGWGFNDLNVRWEKENGAMDGIDFTFKTGGEKIGYACLPSEDTCVSFRYVGMDAWHTEASFEISYPGKETALIDGMQFFGDNQVPPKEVYGIWTAYYSPSEGLNCKGNSETCEIRANYSVPIAPCVIPSPPPLPPPSPPPSPASPIVGCQNTILVGDFIGQYGYTSDCEEYIQTDIDGGYGNPCTKTMGALQAEWASYSIGFDIPIGFSVSSNFSEVCPVGCGTCPTTCEDNDGDKFFSGSAIEAYYLDPATSRPSCSHMKSQDLGPFAEFGFGDPCSKTVSRILRDKKVAGNVFAPPDFPVSEECGSGANADDSLIDKEEGCPMFKDVCPVTCGVCPASRRKLKSKKV